MFFFLKNVLHKGVSLSLRVPLWKRMLRRFRAHPILGYGVLTQENFLKLTTEFGSWAAPIIPEQYPDEFLTDYVRVYKLVE